MIKNYLKIAWRNMMKNKFFSFINVLGLSAGLACCMLIALYVKFETSYDSHQKNIGSLYQVGTSFIKKDNDKGNNSATTPAPMAAAMKQEFPEVIESTRLINLFMEDKTLIQYQPPSGERKAFFEQNGYMADAPFFKMFTYNFIEGNAENSLTNPNSIVISEEIAAKLFGSQPALNKILRIASNTDGTHDCTITGVFRSGDVPSHINAGFFLSMMGGNMGKIIKTQGTSFAFNNMFFTYLLLKPGAGADRLEAKFPSFVKKYVDNDLKGAGFQKKQFLIPVREIHLTEKVTWDITAPASKTYLYVLVSIAVFTLLIACINFMNLSTARSSKRSSEVGIRKVLGAGKSSLVRQFLGESVLTTIIAFLMAIGITTLLLPLFNQASGKQITVSLSGAGVLFAKFFGLALLTGIIAGSYPAFYLSSFNPVKVLKGKLANSLAVVAIRKGLVVFQFIISVVLIIASVVIARQMNYMRSADLGFAKDQQIIIPLRTANAKAIYATLRNELITSGQVADASASRYYPGIFNPRDAIFFKDGQNVDEARHTLINDVDDHFLQTLNFKLAAGRFYSPEFKSDTADKIVVNETLVREIGFASAAKAVGQNIYYTQQGQRNAIQIIGVVKDFHSQDLHSPITPYAFSLTYYSGSFNYFIVHAKTANMATVLNTLQNAWRKLNPTEPLEYNFLDEEFQKNYAAESHLSAIVGYFTVVAILISCLGLFGLAAFTADQRTKEIGVRKVLGASVQTIVSMLSADFLKLILISVVVASPVAWWAMNKWLQGFAYRQPIDWTIFVYSAIIAMVIGVMTIGYQAVKAALANPIKSLRSE